MSLFQKWQILVIAYRDETRAEESGRYLGSWKYGSHKSAMREVARREHKDALEIRHNEYVVVKAV